ncbi:MAG: DEAD/DEAH box helicase family protein [Christensenellaceae bacterium]|jgi:type III restriction enzyme
MKLQFTHQQYQDEAVAAAVNLLHGQPAMSRFSVQSGQTLFDTVSNRLSIGMDDIRKNMQQIQKENLLPQTFNVDSMNFCIEMETGTGKTYVYTQSIYELHKCYGFTKFIIVVPSIAIREGVKKSFDIIHEHFQRLYDNQPIRWFIYNSAHLGNVRDFAESTGIEVMIINIDSFRKSENIINQELDRMNSGRAIDLICDTNPIVIIDEPQSVDTTPKSKEAISSLNPLLTLRYSATHRDKINTIYRLTPVDAYQRGLVKQISVSSIMSMDDFNQPYIRLVSVDNTNGFKARVEIDMQNRRGKIIRTTKPVQVGENLHLLSGERELYRSWTITDIDCTPGWEKIELSGAYQLSLGQSIGGIPDNEFKRAQIYRTIEIHLDKELRLLEQGIKVLSLFFIDRVDRYRTYDEDGNDGKGEYATMFEEEYARLILLPKYKKIRGLLPAAEDVATAHDGYFSVDKKGRSKDTHGNTKDDQNTYELIMKDKERLLSMNTPLRFIFSHSALKEGWDNPNVFQVCTLLEQQSALTCRQKIGRGLRLCVNQNGERIKDKHINSLHIIASESFAEFAKGLQSEIEKETGIKFGVLDIASFEDIEVPIEVALELGIKVPELHEAEPVTDMLMESSAGKEQVPAEPADQALSTQPAEEATSVQPQTVKLGYEGSAKVFEALKSTGAIDNKGRIRRQTREALASDAEQGKFVLPDAYRLIANPIIDRIRKSTQTVEIKDDSKRIVVRRKKQALLSPEFKAIWERIKYKTLYRVQMDMDSFIATATAHLKMMQPIQRSRMVASTAIYDVKKTGVTYEETHSRAINVAEQSLSIPNILYMLQDALQLDLKTIMTILKESGRIEDFINNPERFAEEAIEIIRDVKAEMLMDGIRYKRIAGQEYYLQEIFDKDELTAYLDSNAVRVKNSIYDHIITYSFGVEKRFAEALDSDPDVKLFFKLPDNFKVDTPLGPYNPDWAVLVDVDGTEKLYFVLETKGSLRRLDLRGGEGLKIEYGKKHFAALDDVDFEVAKDWKQFKVERL